MTPNWVTVDKFEQQTGINRNYVLKQCRNLIWPQFHAWDKLSDRIYLINVEWYNQWREMEAASKRRQNQASKSNSSSMGSDAESVLNASPRLPTLDG